MAEEIKRLNYFLGQFLEAEDFQAEQNYHVDMRRRGNRALYYTAGILDGGFQVTKTSDKAIQIGAGIGVDAQGRELVILSPVVKEITGFTGNSDVHVIIEYEENQSDPKNAASDPKNAAEDGSKGNTRWMEAPKIILDKKNLGSDPGKIYITLALITLDAKGDIVEIDLSVRQHANVRLPRHVTVGQGGYGVLNVRHVNGKHWLNDNKDDLFLNWNTGTNVHLGFGENTTSSLFVSGDVTVGGNITLAAGNQLNSPGRMHIAGEENLYLLNKGGTIVSKSWGGNGNLLVEGDVTVGQGGDGVLNVRRVNGKHWLNDNKDDLFLNWNTGTNVHLGFGENTTSSLFVSGDTLIAGNTTVGAGGNTALKVRHINGKKSGTVGDPDGEDDLFLNSYNSKPVHIGQGGLISQSLRVKGEAWFTGHIVADGNITIAGNIGSYGYSPTPRTPGWGGGLHTFDVEAEGSIWCGSDIWCEKGINGKNKDLAENYCSDTILEAGDVVSFDPAKDRIVLCKQAGDRFVCGVISTAPGFILNSHPDGRSGNWYPLALTGRVPCKVTDENGPIRRGDLLSSSSSPGHAMKAQPILVNGEAIHPAGTVIGKSLGNLESDRGIVDIFACLR